MLRSRGGPNGTIVAMATPMDVAGAEVGVLDPKTGKFFPVLTNMNDATSAALPLDGPEQPHLHDSLRPPPRVRAPM